MQAKKWVVVVAGLVVSAANGNGASAQVTYTDRSLFLTALGGSTFLVDFESFVADASYATSPLDVGSFTLSAINAGGGTDFIDVSPFTGFPAIPASFGNATAMGFVNGLVSPPSTIDLTFTSALHGFFADFLFAGNTVPLKITIMFDDATTSDVFVPGVGTDLEPFGFTTTKSFSSIRLSNTVNDGFYFDNVAGGAGAVAGVPEPASVTFTALGLLSLALFKRSRRKA